jgi:hypothetical protein
VRRNPVVVSTSPVFYRSGLLHDRFACSTRFLRLITLVSTDAAGRRAWITLPQPL